MEPWSIREKLCLASSVMKSGDQNWVSVSRAIKPFAEPGRPPDWFSQKHCASQYSELLENTEAPKRKRGEKGDVVETVEDVIVRRLTAERIEELKRLIRDSQEKHRKLKREAELIQAGHLDSRLEELWGEIAQSRKQEEEEAEVKRKATDEAYQARQALRNAPKRGAGMGLRSRPGAASPRSDLPLTADATERPGTAASVSPSPAMEAGRSCLPEDLTQRKLLTQRATPPASPLLSELLKKSRLLPSSPRLVADVGCLTGQGTGSQESQPTPTLLPSSQTVTGAPTLSRLLEAGPSRVSPSTAGSASTSIPPAAAASVVNSPASPDAARVGAVLALENKALEVEDHVPVSYMTHELVMETVGDITAITEDKGGQEVVSLEAVSSLCEDRSYTLSGPWEPPGSEAPGAAGTVFIPSLQRTLEGGTEGVGVPHEACSSSEGCGHPSPSSSFGPSGEVKHTREPGARSESELSEPEHEGEEGGKQASPPSAEFQSDGVDWTQSQEDSQREDSTARQCAKEVMEEEEEMEASLSDAEEGSVSEARGGLLEGGGAERVGDEGAEGSLSEAEGEAELEAELEAAASESEDGCSTRTVCSSLRLHTAADSTPSSPASSQFSVSSEDQEAIQAQKIWKKAIMLVWRAAANHRYANVFLQPVTDEIAPGYHSIVTRPMDLSTIKKNIENGLIRTTAEFQRDIMLMFQNAVMYNSSDHDVFHMALEMQRDVLEQIQQFLATQLIMQTSESGVSAKSLRGREASRKQDTGDKDTVPMASPAFLLSLFDGGTRGRRCAMEADLKMKK
ncbi:bromodomain-containing protein 8 isoform X1 [Brachyhypopomus gauderio]|uniref:bromodomain-containing protein 8 isoform X1 n=1 Tax=Brachyhypopomus gauderio TaxID=698409 RepID=UPI00404280B8